MISEIKKYLSWFWRASEGGHLSILALAAISILGVGISLLFVFLCKSLIDIATSDLDASLVEYAIYLVLILITQIVLWALRSRISAVTGVQMQNSIRQRLFQRLMFTCHSGRRQRHTGDVVNRMEEDVQVVKDTLSVTVPAVLSTGLQFCASFLFLLYLNKHLAWVVVAVMPLALLASRLFVSRMRRLTRDIRDKDSEIQSHLMESVQHVTLLQTLEQESRTIGKLNVMHSEIYRRVMSRTNFNIFSNAVVSIAFSTGYAIAFLWGVVGIYHGTVSFGMMTAFLQLVGQIQRPLVDLSHQLPAIIHATASADRLMELEEDDYEQGVSPRFIPGTAGLRMHDVCFSYIHGDRNVVDHFTYDFKPGSRTAILGETGAGKSTIIRLILALLHQQQGDISIYNDCETARVDASTRCNMVYVPQGNSLLSGTIRENLLLGNPDATEAEMKEVLHMAAAEFVDELPEGLDTQCAELGVGLSEGQAQRIAIARALLRKGSILLLDEFSSSLDEATETRLIHSLMYNLPGRTMIFITHRTKITAYCNDIIHVAPKSPHPRA